MGSFEKPHSVTHANAFAEIQEKESEQSITVAHQNRNRVTVFELSPLKTFSRTPYTPFTRRSSSDTVRVCSTDIEEYSSMSVVRSYLI